MPKLNLTCREALNLSIHQFNIGVHKSLMLINVVNEIFNEHNLTYNRNSNFQIENHLLNLLYNKELIIV